MNQTQQLTTVYSAVKVIDDASDRAGQVGAYLGVDRATDKHNVKFDDGKTEEFTTDQLQVL
ncbi:hypothetical protein HAV22_21385 [Massilia sp. TW-1]|uniref:Uncharacterized protein n=1 Tax=Telluria antibiotica TaxID=2717319 RepID=A0ABX0PHZ3_9BURK|nr:hypothetical protein [Telluria antibiotica]NIA56189.1 hypothetical protein [Telluria antibiotica]